MYIRITDDDFYTATGTNAPEFMIECTFEEFKSEEAKNFIEWLTFYRKDETDDVCYMLTLRFRAWKEKNRIFTELKAGNIEDGVQMDGKARELLKCIYLRPLRDAAREMNSGRNTRISQILYSHPVFCKREGHKLVEILSDANEKVERYFTDEDGKIVLGTIRSILKEFRAFGEPDKVSFEASGIADIIGLNLEKHGVSLVNVSSIAFFRFANTYRGESNICVQFDNVFGVKGETHDAIKSLKSIELSKPLLLRIVHFLI